MKIRLLFCGIIPVFMCFLASCSTNASKKTLPKGPGAETINPYFPQKNMPGSFLSIKLKSSESIQPLPLAASVLFQAGNNRDETSFFPVARYVVDSTYHLYHIYIMDEGWTSDWLYIYNKVNGIFENQPIMVSGNDNDDDQWFIRTSKTQDINQDHKTDLIISDHVSYVVTDSLPAESDLKVADTLIWNNGFR